MLTDTNGENFGESRGLNPSPLGFIDACVRSNCLNGCPSLRREVEVEISTRFRAASTMIGPGSLRYPFEFRIPFGLEELDVALPFKGLMGRTTSAEH